MRLLWLQFWAIFIGIEARSRNGVYSTSFVFLTATNQKTGESVQICANYLQSQIREVAKTRETAEVYPLVWWAEQEGNLDLCNGPRQFATTPYSGSIVPLSYRVNGSSKGDRACVESFNNDSSAFRNVTQSEVDELKSFGASAALLLLNKGQRFVTSWRDFLFSDFTDPYVNASDAIPTFFAYKEDFDKKIITLDHPSNHPSITLQIHRPPSSQWDASMLIIWLLAVGAVTGGGFWAFYRHNNGKDENRQVHHPEPEDSKGCCNKHANTLAILILMVVLVSILMLGYYFRPVLIVVFNIFLVVLGSFSVYGCANALLSNLKCARPQCCVTPLCARFPEMGCISHAPSLAAFFLYGWCLALCVFWFFTRNAPYAWILLDFINFTMCLHILKSLRLPSLKWITGLMVCMFVYDAFMVFFTPFLTPSGCSVMLQVATGLDCSSSSGGGYPTPPIDANLPEKFPMLMQVMHFDPMLECVDVEVERGYQMTILGLGDIIIPGYLISHCFTMGGFPAQTRLIYGIICSIGYGVGLVITFVALTLMGIAQPALIYLVPATLIPVCITALIRKEWGRLWHGAQDKSDITPLRLTDGPMTPPRYINRFFAFNITGEDAVLNREAVSDDCCTSTETCKNFV
ncbi:unnamed protein product, partial [Mesorhabditis belari]|uniref:Signal peptide peptidase-like 2B n=1 Tax=Mesorhabditis belari TaxID=2138241 RepID=A0AAF3EIZ7_9BILA